MTTLYISGPMTGIAEHNFPMFNRAEQVLRNVGYTILNPATKGIIEGWTWEQYLKWDLAEVLKADGIATLPGFTNSRGAMLETFVANTLKIPVWDVDTWFDFTAIDYAGGPYSE